MLPVPPVPIKICEAEGCEHLVTTGMVGVTKNYWFCDPCAHAYLTGCKEQKMWDAKYAAQVLGVDPHY